MAAREDVKGFEHTDVAVDGTPQEFDDGGNRGEEEGNFLSNGVGPVDKHEDRNGNSEEYNEGNIRDTGFESKHERAAVCAMLPDSFGAIANILSLPEGALMQDVTAVAEVFVDNVLRCSIQAVEIIQNMTSGSHGRDSSDPFWVG